MKLLISFHEFPKTEDNKQQLFMMSKIAMRFPYFNGVSEKNDFFETTQSVEYPSSYVRGEFEGRIRTDHNVNSVFLKLDFSEGTADLVDISEIESLKKDGFEEVDVIKSLELLRSTKLKAFYENGNSEMLSVRDVMKDIDEANKMNGIEDLVSAYDFFEEYDSVKKYLNYSLNIE